MMRTCLALLEVIEKEPSEFGYDFTIWTIDRLRAHLEKKTGISLSESRFRALLKRKGYRYRRPKYDLGHLQDKEAKAKAAEVPEELKKRSWRRFRAHLYGRNDRNLGSTVRACWMNIGNRTDSSYPRSKQKRHIFGGYNWLQDTITWTTAKTKNSAAFIGFLEELLVKRYPTKRVILVMDNASYHKSASALAALSLFEHRVMVIWLPPYCSDLNPIERFWRF